MHLLATALRLPVILALSLTAAAIAQQPHPAVPGRSTPSPQPAATSDPNRPPMPIIDVEFPGGPLSDFVRAIQAAAMESTAKTPINVIIPTEATDIRITAISLKRVSAETALESLRYAFGIQGTHQLEARNMTNDGDQGLTFAVQYAPGRSSPQVTSQMQMQMQPVQSEAYSLRELIDAPSPMPQDDPSLRMSADSILAALKLAAELEAADGRSAPTQLLFHPDTQLLIARGAPDQHRLIHSVLNQLQEMLQQRRAMLGELKSRAQKSELQMLELESQTRMAMAQLDKARSELRPAEAEISRIEKLVAQGLSPETDLERSRAQLEVAMANVRSAEAHAQMMKSRAEILARDGAARAELSTTLQERVLAIYDVRDLAQYKGDFLTIVKQVIGSDGKMEVKPISGDPTGSLAIRATRAQHEILVSIFNTARRLKTGEPKLPGMTVDQLLQQSKE